MISTDTTPSVQDRKIWHRIHDRAWSEIGKVLSIPIGDFSANRSEEGSHSISGETPWISICAAYADGAISSKDFRRNNAVRQIVETVGPVDGRFYASRVREWGPNWLTDDAISRIDAWGNPIRWPAMLLGTPHAFSPTTLRYLATALWLRKRGFIEDGSNVAEIGVGFGGLAAINAAISRVKTTLADLPQVEQAAKRMITENGFGESLSNAPKADAHHDLVISNYAFTELDSDIQQHYLERYLVKARRGVIVSNSAVFAGSIKGRTDAELVTWLNDAGIPAKIETQNELLGPSDHICGVTLIHW